MFTGIVDQQGTVVGIGARLKIRPHSEQCAAAGASIAVNGVCLTAAVSSEDGFEADLSRETLSRTNLGSLAVGSLVNLERPLTIGGSLGGHLVQGHVDSTAEVASISEDGDGALMWVRPPDHLRRYIAEKGSVALDGVSLTVASCSEESFSVALVPFTRKATTLGVRRPGDLVNLEVDLIARYLEVLTMDRQGLRST